MLNNPWIVGGGPVTQMSNQMDSLGNSGHMLVQTQSVSIASTDGSVIHQTNTYESWVTLSGPQPMSLDVVPNACSGQNLFNSLELSSAPVMTPSASDTFLALPVNETLPPAPPSVAVSMHAPFVAHNHIEPIVALPTSMGVAEPSLVAGVQNPAETFIAVPVPAQCDPLVAVPAVQSLYNPILGASDPSVPIMQTPSTQNIHQNNVPSWYLVVQDMPDATGGINGFSETPSVVRTDDDLFLCLRCNSTFEKVSCINWHLQECKGGGLKGSSLALSDQLSSASLQVKTLQCSMCARFYSVIHDPTSSFVCSECSTSTVPYSFSQVTALLRPFKCSECGDCFQQVSELEDHEASHKSSVTICELPDNYREDNSSDEDSASVIIEPTVEAPKEDGESGSESSDNMEAEPSSSETCGECGSSFDSREVLDDHLKSHISIRSYGCTKCGIICVGKYSLNRHVWTHKQENKENIADSSFEELEEDTKDGIVAQPFGCTECGMQFSDSDDLKEHCVSHLRSKPFLCTQCGEKFETTSSLERHWAAHAFIIQ